MSRRTAQVNRSRGWDGLLRFEYAGKPAKIGAGGNPDLVAALERVVRDQGDRIARLEAAWSRAIERKGQRYTKQ